MRKTWVLFLLFILIQQNYSQAQRVKKVMLQGFWWDYRNNNFTNKWSDYLTELSPRLSAIGIDAVWVPPAYKCNATSSVGYNPFDHYDLGDKYQKGGADSLNVRTRMGNKNELLRMIAVMHANGMEVIEDIVLNHTNEAGTNTGVGGQDPQTPYSVANANGYKNFRYVSYATPLVNETQNDYWTRAGRWPKNYTNFYPNAGNVCTTGDICSPYFGPDVSYEYNAFGPSSNIPQSGSANIGTATRNYVNPLQSSNYMRDNARGWMMWLKKQTSFDGWRFDAVKHYPVYVQEDLIYNTKYTLPDFAKGGESMFSLGEWIGTKTELDNYMNNVRSGSELHTGTFDFGLRGYCPSGGLYSMVLSQGNYNMQNIPGEQQTLRYFDYGTQRVHRTVPFVNNHDNFRPILDATGKYSRTLGNAAGWNTSQELGGNGQHIDPREPRLYAAYATIFSLDGNPTVFFEDLFDIGTTGKRYTHLPSSTTDLPVRPDIVNIIQAHQALKFKNGDYAVPTSLAGYQAPFYSKGTKENHLVIERTNQAIIGITDKYGAVSNNNSDEEVWVSVSGSWRDLDLIDYSGAHGISTTRVYSDGRVLIKTAPVGHTISGARGHGYSIWAPKPVGVNFATVNDLYNYLAKNCLPGRNSVTVQEWEMADDLGDSHAKSLKQGGKLPAYSTAERLAGSIYVAAGKTVYCKVFPEFNGYNHTVSFFNAANVLVATASGISANNAPLLLTYTPVADGWISIKVKNTTAENPGQRVWVNTEYIAPLLVNTRTNNTLITKGVSTLNEETTNDDAYNFNIFPNPTNGKINFNWSGASPNFAIDIRLSSLDGSILLQTKDYPNLVEKVISSRLSRANAGVYFLQLNIKDKVFFSKIVRL